MAKNTCGHCIRYPHLSTRTIGEKRPVCPHEEDFTGESPKRNRKSQTCQDFKHFITCGLCAAYKTPFCNWTEPSLSFKSDLACGDYYPDRHIRQILEKKRKPRRLIAKVGTR